ncbi:hypothetical protein M5C72_04945 [Companilactobacillus allii]|uniref:DUF1642 domain-containing protein n=1 Tax=Companilactobacillus allii TaxID=1847728 RepID=A0A1P8Q3N8_9LACO|nr:hypothetical protein [Companilactobacillus allii]APX72470.1 hypothetical protein BTM29_07870 [Companilactobacillus allii]USQ69569.1 hypothetical protein M5C72_04945 [Companilactobacillus allii]
MRILKGYSKEVRKELKNIKGYTYPLALLTDEDFEDTCPNLNYLIRNIDVENDDKQTLQDIADYINDKADFDEQLYYVRFASDPDFSYLNRGIKDDHLFISNKGNWSGYQTKFTMDEIEDLGDKYVPFAIPVSEVNE